MSNEQSTPIKPQQAAENPKPDQQQAGQNPKPAQPQQGDQAPKPAVPGR